jgi:predicted dehydrogenase
MTEPIAFGIVGTGWRAEFFLRVARACPDLFRVVGIVGRTAAKANTLADRFGTRTYGSWRALVDQAKPQFVVSSVTWAAAPEIMSDLVRAKVPVLSETPPAPTSEALVELWRALGSSAPVQVAEQYAFQPHHAARLSFVYSGRLGPISQAQVSVAHGYHGVNLMRRFLGVGFEPALLTGKRFRSRVIGGANRSGPPSGETVKEVDQDIVWFDYGGKLGVMDFSGEQYFSYIRDPRLLVRGERGELFNDSAVYLKDHVTPLRVRFERHEGGAGGNLEGKHLKGIQAGDEWLYRNLFAPAPLPDDDIAVATCLLLMSEFVRTGQPFYSLAEACQDAYLSFVANEAAMQGAAQAHKQIWAA